MKKVTITLDVWYDESTIQDEDVLLMALERETERAIGDGLLTSGGEIVDTYELKVDCE